MAAYVQRLLERLAWASRVRAFRSITVQQPVECLEKPEFEALLAVPDPAQPHGRREHALLLFLYNTGVPVSEAAQLQVGDLRLGNRVATTARSRGRPRWQARSWGRT